MKRKTKRSRKICLYTEICSGYFFPQRGHKTSQCEQDLFVLGDYSKPQHLISRRVQRVRRSGKGPILLPPHPQPSMPVVNFIATRETCSGEARGDAGQAVGLSPTLSGSQGQRVPGSLGTLAGAPVRRLLLGARGRGFLRRKPEGASAAGAAGAP